MTTRTPGRTGFRLLAATAATAALCLTVTACQAKEAAQQVDVGAPANPAETPAADVPPIVLATAGADATDYVMRAVVANWSSNPANTSNVPAVGIPSLPDSPYTVPADSTCEARTYVVTGTPPATYTAPASAGAGKTALNNPTNLTNGCIDIARSSSGPATGEPAGYRYFGFARDVMTWAAFGGGKAPASLTKSQIKGIYDCTYTDWSEVGGQPGQIKRYFTQPGSGAGQQFRNNLLDGFDPTTVSSASCPAVIGVQQSHANLVASADRPFAIMPYGSSDWIAQANGVIPNFRAGVVARPVTVAGTPLSPITGPKFGKYSPNTAVITGGQFPGVRTLYNLLHTNSVAYSAALAAVGFDAANPTTGVKSPLCTGQLNKILSTYGYVPFSADANGITCTFSTP